MLRRTIPYLLSNSIKNASIYTKPNSYFQITKLLQSPIHHLIQSSKTNSSFGTHSIRAYSLLTLNDLRDNKGATKQKTRTGPGIGSGKGNTAGLGHKGQKARDT
ncbi:hypothetical protein R6Q59_014550 [Mikania micrantha]